MHGPGVNKAKPHYSAVLPLSADVRLDDGSVFPDAFSQGRRPRQARQPTLGLETVRQGAPTPTTTRGTPTFNVTELIGAILAACSQRAHACPPGACTPAFILAP